MSKPFGDAGLSETYLLDELSCLAGKDDFNTSDFNTSAVAEKTWFDCYLQNSGDGDHTISLTEVGEDTAACQLMKCLEKDNDSWGKCSGEAPVYKDQVCRNELLHNVWGITLLVAFLAFVGILLTYLKHTQLGALTRKTFLFRKNKRIRSFSVQTCELLVLVLVSVLVSLFSGTEDIVLQQYETSNGTITLTYTVPNAQRRGFYTILSIFGPLLFLCVFTYPIAATISAIVQEKETRIKESLRIAGMGEISWAFSWLISIVTKYLPLCLACAVVCRYGNLFIRQTISEITLFFISFVIYNIGFSIFLAAFVHANTKVAALSIIIISYSFYFVNLSSTILTLSQGQLLGMCALPSLCLSWGVRYMFSSSLVFYTQMAQIYGHETNFPNAIVSSLAMIAYGMLYFILGLYLQYVIPQKYGIRRHWLFPFHSIRRRFKRFLKRDSILDIEADSNSLEIRGLCKSYYAPGLENNRRNVLQNFSLTAAMDNITVLIGTNGAGKSTTFNILTGITQPTSGSIKMLGQFLHDDTNSCEDKVNSQGMDGVQIINSFVGYVPQYDATYEQMTVRENLELFRALRTPSCGTRCKVEDEYSQLLEDVDLVKALDWPSGILSGGQKRKLALCMALMGDTKILLIDEVTSGVDPASRRSIWNILKKYKKNRVVLCTTHFLDEADFLGDQVAILQAGRVAREGTPGELKGQAMKESKTINIIVTTSRKEDFLRLQKEIATLITSIEAKENTQGVKEKTTMTMLAIEGSVEVSFCYTTLNGNSKHIQFLDSLQNQNTFQELNIGIQVCMLPTLEEVFLSTVANQENMKNSDDDCKDLLNAVHLASSKHLLLRGKVSTSSISTINNAYWSPTRFMALLFRKRMIITMRNWMLFLAIFIASILISTFPLVFNMSKMEIVIPNTVKSREFSKGCVERLPDGLVNIQNTTIFQDGDNSCCNSDDYASPASDLFQQCMATKPQCVNISASSPIINHCTDRYQFCRLYPRACPTSFEYCCDVMSEKSVIFSCTTSYFLESSSGWNSNGCLDRNEIKTKYFFLAVMESIVVMVAFSFVGVPVIAAAVLERQQSGNSKFMQIMSGVTSLEYWTASYVVDQLYVFLVGISICISYSFYSSILSNEEETRNMVTAFGITLIFVFSFTLVPFCYALSFHFTDHSKALVSLVVLMMVSGTALCIVVAIFSTIEVGDDSDGDQSPINLWIGYIDYGLNLLPSYALTTGLFHLKYAFFTFPSWEEGFEDEYVRDIKIDFTKRVVYMVVTGILSVLYVFLQEKFGMCSCKCGKKSDFSSKTKRFQDTPGVMSEIERIQKQGNNDVLQVVNVSKGYLNQPFLTVDNLSFGIKRGETFGFLGVNGAGKSSTVNMITGVIPVSSGNIVVNGKNVTLTSGKSDIRYLTKQINYCTQSDTLFPYLSVYEHIYFYASLYGYSRPHIEEIVELSIERINLEHFRHTQSQDLSGGNKRKLMTAIVLLGCPQLVILDEPSSGMDPFSQRFLWDTIKSEQNKSQVSFMLTSHSMEEVEYLCDRTSILVDGTLSCIGPIRHLCSKFVSLVRVELQLVQTVSEYSICPSNSDLLRNSEPEDVHLKFENIKSCLKDHFGDVILSVCVKKKSLQLCLKKECEHKSSSNAEDPANETVENEKETVVVSVSNVAKYLFERMEILGVEGFNISDGTFDDLFNTVISMAKVETHTE